MVVVRLCSCWFCGVNGDWLVLFVVCLFVCSFVCLFVCLFVCSFVHRELLNICWFFVVAAAGLPRHNATSQAFSPFRTMAKHGPFGFPQSVGYIGRCVYERTDSVQASMCSPNYPLSIFYRIFRGIANQRSTVRKFQPWKLLENQVSMRSKGSSILGHSRHSPCRLWQLPVHQSSMIFCAIVCWHLGLMDMDVGFVWICVICIPLFFVDMNKSRVGNACNICQYIWSLSNQHPHSCSQGTMAIVWL